MGATISTGNDESQPKKFLVEMISGTMGSLGFPMASKIKPSTPVIHLAAWLDLMKIGPSEAARIAGCSQGYISNIARGAKTNVNALYLLRLSEHMGLTVNDFYRAPPPVAQIERLADYSQAAQTTLLNLKRRKA